MATVGDLVDRVGLRSLTPGAVEKARDHSVSTFYEIDSASGTDFGLGAVVYVPAGTWPSLSAPESIPAQLRSGGGVGVVVDNDDFDLPPEFVTECVRQSMPVFLLPKDMHFVQLRETLAPQPAVVPNQDSNSEAVQALIDEFVGKSEVAVWVAMQGCVITGSIVPGVDFPIKILSRNPTSLEGMPSDAAGIHLQLPRSGHAVVLANPNRAQWDVRRVAMLAGQVDARLHALEVTRVARAQSENALIRELVQANVASAALDPWARSLGLEPGIRIRAVSVIASESMPDRIDAVVAGLQDLALHSGGASVSGSYEGNAYALVTMSSSVESVDGSEGFDRQLDVLAALFVERHDCPLFIGTSSCVLRSSDDLVRGLISARQMADRHARSSKPESPSVPLPAPVAATLLATDPRLASVLDRTLLKPVVDYDERKGSQYLATLRTFLALDGQWSATAAELGIHINTLRYRLNRIERLTGRGVHSTADRADFYIALALRESSRRAEWEASRPPGFGEPG
ncbi:PucR family transcriptional regulator [Rhodococcus sp. KBS0724]|uniref:PucR family transcriptional regulator n=1 Tax=Rhodococcus sp. KBS0724 TaxID=1179674 RepID=UPI00110DBBC2|nr:helix-turn-helix domain-containing protein [Rhodococcus sp. KBS0724]TSD49897.1 PucR family transcriptional regulator [Rhodococcus sp. KBS0724]